jgi:hypothetical protein
MARGVTQPGRLLTEVGQEVKFVGVDGEVVAVRIELAGTLLVERQAVSRNNRSSKERKR